MYVNPLERMVSFRINTLVYKALHHSTPISVSDILIIKGTRLSLHSYNKHFLQRLKFNFNYSDRALAERMEQTSSKDYEFELCYILQKPHETHLSQIAYKADLQMYWPNYVCIIILICALCH